MTWVDQALGRHTVLDPLPLNTRKADKGQRVRRVTDGEGTRWVLKQVAVAQEWSAEVHAYTSWLTVLGDDVPALLSADEELRVLLLSEVPGRHPGPASTHAHRRAGAVLRRLHQARPAQEQTAADLESALQRLERLVTRSRDVLTVREQAFVRAQGAELAALPLGDKVPCHGDYRPHNWLLEASTALRVIDFGKSRFELAAWDLTKLFLRPWWRRPDLAHVFLEGYGRRLEADEAEYVQRRMAIDAVSHTAFGVVRGSERHVRFGRSRLTDLMAGHQVVPERLRQREW